MSEQEYVDFARPLDLKILEATEGAWFNLLHLHGDDVNLWWYGAAHLDSPAGRRFRRRRAKQIMDMADAIVRAHWSPNEIADKAGFLFLDNHEGEKSLARRYWRRFCAAVDAEHHYDALPCKIAYMVAADPVFEVHEYVSAWLDEPDMHNATQALHAFENLSIEKQEKKDTY